MAAVSRGTPTGRDMDVLMPSTRPEFLQVISRRVACFRVVKLTVFAVQDDLWAEFDSGSSADLRRLASQGLRPAVVGENLPVPAGCVSRGPG